MRPFFAVMQYWFQAGNIRLCIEGFVYLSHAGGVDALTDVATIVAFQEICIKLFRDNSLGMKRILAKHFDIAEVICFKFSHICVLADARHF